MGVVAAPFAQLVRESDYISIHVPLVPETTRLFNYEIFQQMKPTAILINTSRGDIIDSQALLRALDEGLIAGAGLDVFSPEPPPANDPLIIHPKTVATPHAAFNSEESLVELRQTAATQMADALSGRKPDNIVNPQVLTSAQCRWRLAVT
jgi:D-3-phosphoglycerate dehydrogenase